MRKGLLAALTAALALTVGVGVAPAVPLSNGAGTTASCGGTWHFVNNQTGGTQTPGTLTATFSTADGTIARTVTASAVNQNTQHFNVVLTEGATLLSASTNLAGRLVLSDAPICEEPPPECDPKVDPKCEEPPPPPCDPKDPKCT